MSRTPKAVKRGPACEPMITTNQFIDLLSDSRLLDEKTVKEVRESAGDQEAKAIAIALIRRGLITKWQGEQLLGGQTLFFLGKYKLLRKLGEGGMGAVYQAQEEAGMRRTLAIKVMGKDTLGKTEGVRRFLREVEAAAALSHQNIVAAYDADKFGKSYFLVMEYVDGRDLNAWLAEYESLPIGWACECIRQAALGLQHAHERGLVHRDIKPANLLVVANDLKDVPLVKILDMGIAQFASGDNRTKLTQTGQIIGTVDYIAPEQAENTNLADIRSDIFSLGCTLFELITHKLPYPGQNVTEKLFARATKECPAPSSFREDVPEELDEIVMTMAAREKERRFREPLDVAEALEPFCLHGPDSVETPRKARAPRAAPAPTRNSADSDTNLDAFLSRIGEEESKPTIQAEPTIATAVHKSSEGPPQTLVTEDDDETEYEEEYRYASSAPSKQWMMFAGAGAVLVVLLLLVGLLFYAGSSSTEPVAADNTPDTRSGFGNISAADWKPNKGNRQKQTGNNATFVQPTPTNVPQSGDSPVMVFVLAGQSNMGGKGSISHLDQLTREQPAVFGHLKTNQGAWVVREDVWIRSQGRSGGLTVGYGERSSEFSPALGFGHVLGSHLDNQVLIIKITQGPMSLMKEGRPPSSGGDGGPYYHRLVNETTNVVENLGTYFPGYDGKGYKIAGFVWFQAWNDQINDEATAQYATNLANLIRDLRTAWNAPDMPVVIGELGIGGENPGRNKNRVLRFRRAQASVAEMPEFRGNVSFARTASYFRSQPAHGPAFLYHGNAETFYLMGDAFGKAMAPLLDNSE